MTDKSLFPEQANEKPPVDVNGFYVPSCVHRIESDKLFLSNPEYGRTWEGNLCYERDKNKLLVPVPSRAWKMPDDHCIYCAEVPVCGLMVKEHMLCDKYGKPEQEWNWVSSCASCNTLKHEQHIIEFICKQRRAYSRMVVATANGEVGMTAKRAIKRMRAIENWFPDYSELQSGDARFIASRHCATYIEPLQVCEEQRIKAERYLYALIALDAFDTPCPPRFQITRPVTNPPQYSLSDYLLWHVYRVVIWREVQTRACEQLRGMEYNSSLLNVIIANACFESEEDMKLGHLLCMSNPYFRADFNRDALNVIKQDMKTEWGYSRWSNFIMYMSIVR